MSVEFEGILLKPLSEQSDRDGDYIDPDGVTFAGNPQPIWWEFNYDIPKDLMGWGTVSRAEDGSLVVKGTLIDDVIMERHRDGREPLKLAIGIVAEKIEKPICRKSSLMSVALTRQHADPAQPGITIRKA